jgi:hypothetical protein
MLRRSLLFASFFSLAIAGCSGNDAPDPASGHSDAGADAAPDASQTDTSPPDSPLDIAPDTPLDGKQDAPDGSLDALVDHDLPDGPTEASDASEDVAPDTSADTGTDRPCTLGGDECEPGEKCAPLGVNEALVCRPDGDKLPGETCGASGLDDCAAGSACVDYDSTLSTCRPLCNTTVPCPGDHLACFPWFGPSGSVAGICLGDDCLPPAVGCEDGQRCTVLSAASIAIAACVPAGPVPVGGDCSTDECAPGAMCVKVGASYVCRAYCDAGADCGSAHQHCAWPWPALPEIGLCTEGCDPVRQTGCGTDQGCYFMDPADGSTDCFPAGTLPEGADCSSLVDFCLPGLDCVLEPGSGPSFQYFCRAFCDAEHLCTSGNCSTTQATEALKFCMP